MKIKIAIVDDHPLIVEGLQNMLRDHTTIEVVASYSSGAQLLQGVELSLPDVLLLDISMPVQSGDEIAKILKKKYPEVKMIALTNLDDIYHIQMMLQLGVSGYLLKNTKQAQLIEAIETVISGKTFLEEKIKKKIQGAKLQSSRDACTRNMLTRREKEVLKLIIENNNSKEIAEKLFVSKRTIDHHRESIIAKLNVKNVSALLKKAMELGIIEV